ncbi:autotransporter outer membrane beta-barrel domain-containing protein [Nitrosomonas eutropha]|uniref:autotransporter outer membrane beta-barrel domain-containing protein n=1 Tax=Nitrosomonas eutropha TaxID=916 RepID=UPI0008BD5EA6|nr:autotransporter outer membrane beta-barrel domain-containing protein [Nitrosomonas eutropha]SEJ00610.1 autotransporter family porin [Nitrosomonas eutropha]
MLLNWSVRFYLTRSLYSNQDTVHARLGARLDKIFTNATGQQFTPWLRANLWFSPEHDASTTFTTMAGTHATSLNTSLGGKWAQLGAGISGQIRQNVNVFASADYNHNIGKQESRGISGRIGLKVSF